jgi:hypothetical protein
MTTEHHLDFSAGSEHYLDGGEKLKADIEKTGIPANGSAFGVGW